MEIIANRTTPSITSRVDLAIAINNFSVITPTTLVNVSPATQYNQAQSQNYFYLTNINNLFAGTIDVDELISFCVLNNLISSTDIVNHVRI